MTTIVTDGHSMACDGLITSGDTIIENDRNKIFKLKDGSIVGFAGNTFNWQELIKWFETDPIIRGKWPKVTGNCAIIHLLTDGSVLTYDEEGRTWSRPSKNAIGSGRNYALGALDAGLPAVRACNIASLRDVHSGGTIRVLHLDVHP